MHTRPFAIALCISALAVFVRAGFAETPAQPAANTLIVPGESIGGIFLGSGTEGQKEERALGEPAGSDAALGGQGSNEWYLGAHPGDKGLPFHRPGEIGENTQIDVAHDSAAHPGKVTCTKLYTTSPRFATAEGIAPGSTLEAIRAKFPGIQPDYANYSEAKEPPPVTIWPGYGEMEFYLEKKQGIEFAVRKSDGVCIEIDIVPRETAGTYHYPPIASGDYTLDDIEGCLGDIKLGMTSVKLLALLGKPDEERKAGSIAGGAVWKWRVPAQAKEEPPGLSIYLRKLPDGTLIAEQIRLSSPVFMLNGTKVSPGSPLKEALRSKPGFVKNAQGVDKNAPDIYCDQRNGLFIEVRKADAVCTAITIFSPPLVIH